MAEPTSAIFATVQSLKNDAGKRASRDLRHVRGMSKALADLLAEVYGGQWNLRVNYERGVVVIARVIEGGGNG